MVLTNSSQDVTMHDRMHNEHEESTYRSQKGFMYNDIYNETIFTNLRKIIYGVTALSGPGTRCCFCTSVSGIPMNFAAVEVAVVVSAAGC